MTEKVGILGGSFDPFHRGHYSIACAALTELGLNRLVIMPARQSPFKIGRGMASGKDRMAMAEAFLASMGSSDIIKVSGIEVEGDSVSYTFNTLCRLEEDFPDKEIWFIMGGDSFFDLEDWYKGPEMLGRFHFAVAPRPGCEKAAIDRRLDYYKKRYNADIEILHSPLIEVSSTDIRRDLFDGRSIEDKVGAAVERYIDEHRLYRKISK